MADRPEAKRDTDGYGGRAASSDADPRRIRANILMAELFKRRDGTRTPKTIFKRLKFEKETMRIPDRQGMGRSFVNGAGEMKIGKLKPVGRPWDLHGDVEISVSRIRAMKNG